MSVSVTMAPSTPSRSLNLCREVQQMHENKIQQAANRPLNALPQSAAYVSPSDALHSPATMKVAAFRNKQNIYGSRKQKPLFMRSIQARQHRLVREAAEAQQKVEAEGQSGDASEKQEPMFADIRRQKE